MTLAEAMDVLVEELSALLENYELETPEKGKRRAIRVVKGWMEPMEPPKATQGPLKPGPPEHPVDGVAQIVPYLLVRPSGHEDNGDGESSVSLHLIACLHAERGDGIMDIVNLIEHIRQFFLSRRILGGKIALEFPIKSKIPQEDQPYPYWVGSMETKWIIAQSTYEWKGW